MANETQIGECRVFTAHDALFQYSPGLATPDESGPYFLGGYFLILLCNFTTTYTHPILPYIRLLAAIPAAKLLWDYGFSSSFDVLHRNRQTDLAMALLSLYGLLKVTEVCVVGFWNRPEDWPKWLSRGDVKENGEGEGKDAKGINGKLKIIPFTPTILGRMLYAFDLLSVRGSSYLPNRIWDYAPKSMVEWKPPSRPRFLAFLIWESTTLYLLIDIFESLAATRTWDTSIARPLTSTLPLHLQFFYAFLVCGMTALSIATPYYVNALLTMPLGVPPSAWPPMFDQPFRAKSLQDFWSYRWHTIFRRTSDEISRGILFLLPSSYFTFHPRFIKLLRALIIFGISMVLHFFLVWALPIDDETYPYAAGLINPQIAKFFLSQPLGIFIELVLVQPMTAHLPDGWRKTIRRAFAWGWLLWSGRYWSDVWISRGLWGAKERYVLFSPVRRIVYGRWTPC
ncbi:hypothetical protein FRC03_012583 [Tulasnella sp. 419]|nr:hypothetical protein FRC03_012583 [Tulasnella sp. 419]